MIPSIALLVAVALTSQLAGQVEAGFLDLDLNETVPGFIADLKTIEPVDCGNALAELGKIWLTERECIGDFNEITDFFEAIKFPSIDIKNFKVILDTGVLPEAPDVDYEGLCATGGCISQVAALQTEIDGKCQPDSWTTLSPEIANIIRAVRAFTKIVCIKNDDGEFCLDEFISDIRAYNPMDDASDPEIRKGLCSECSEEIQAGLFGSLAPDFAYSIARMYCFRDDESGDFCPKSDLLLGASYAKIPYVAWDVVYDDEDICASSCAARAVVVAGGQPPEACFEEDEGAFSYAFKFVGQKTGLGQDDVTEVVEALQKDIGNAIGLFSGDVGVVFDEVKGFVVTLKTKFADGSNETNTEFLPETELDFEAVMRNSPFIETNQVADKVIEDPTQNAEVKTASVDTDSPTDAPTDSSSSSRRAWSIVAVTVAAVAIVGIAL